MNAIKECPKVILVNFPNIKLYKVYIIVLSKSIGTYFCNIFSRNEIIIIIVVRRNFLKKLKYNNYLNYIILPYLTNNLVMYCCQDITAIQFLLPHISKTILFSKIDNTFYSLNNIETYLSSTNELYNYLNI